MNLANNLSVLFLFKEPTFSVIDFCCYFIPFYFIHFSLIFVISFLLLTLGFVCSFFSSCFRYKVVYLLFFLFLEIGLNYSKLSS